MSPRPAPYSTPVPTRWVGPIRLSGNAATGEIEVPLATYESPLWPSVGRGAKVSRLIEGGITATLVDARMARSSLFVAPDAAAAHAADRVLHERRDELAATVESTSRFARLVDLHTEIVGNLLFTRFALSTGDASGHNMVTKAAEALMETILSWDLGLEYGSVSGNYCTDKKPSAVNGDLGRGRRVVADILIPHEVLEKTLRTTATRMVDLVVRKNLVGGTVAGSLRSANAHFANMLLAIYLATGAGRGEHRRGLAGHHLRRGARGGAVLLLHPAAPDRRHRGQRQGPPPGGGGARATRLPRGARRGREREPTGGHRGRDRPVRGAVPAGGPDQSRRAHGGARRHGASGSKG
jgi:hydroxymethylglutaryl-CoA reductase